MLRIVSRISHHGRPGTTFPFRCLTSSSASSGAAASTATSLSTPARFVIRSRRVYKRDHPRTKHIEAIIAETKAKKLEVDNKPWPNSVKYTGAVLASVLIPYLTGFVIASLPSLRETILNKKQLESLRKWFGTEDPAELPYPDQRTCKALPRHLPGEPSERERLYQDKLESTLADDNMITVKMVPLDSNDQILSTLEKTVQLPASRWARPQELHSLLFGSGSSAESSQVACLALEFPEVSDHTNESTLTDDSKMGDSWNASTDAASDAVSDSDQNKDPLSPTIAIYSTWHYQSHAPTATHVTQSLTNEELQIHQLEADLKRLEAELKGNPQRPMDDVLEEIAATKAMLRRLKWNKWLPWNRK